VHWLLSCRSKAGDEVPAAAVSQQRNGIMLEIRTERLQLIALTLSQLGLYVVAPGQLEEVEIGYGIDPAYRNRGYMTEAVRGLIDWAFRDPRCRSITAPSTERSNIASNRVLEKVGMRVSGETDEALDWRLDRTGQD
jgi:RimJ/RimL family protein N-acetyltransferase